MTSTLSGSNSFALRHKLHEIIDSFVKDYGDLAVEDFDAEEATASEILDAIGNLPFLAAKKLVVIRSPDKNKDLADKIEQIIGSDNDQSEVVFVLNNPDKRTVLYKTLKTKTRFTDFPELDKPAVARWLVEKAKSNGAVLESRDANYLVDRVGANQEMLSNELDKLINYDPQISRTSIDLLTEPTPQSKVFDLLDAAFAGRKSRALELYEEQRIQKVEPQAILALIAWQLQIFTVLKLAGKRSVNEVSKDFGISSFPLTKAAPVVRKLSFKQLQQMVHEAYKMDIASKTRTYDLDEALKTYIVTL